MHPENVWKWLDAVDQDNLDPLDQWGEPPPRRESTPPAGILLRNGSIRMTGQDPEVHAYDAENENHPHSLVPGLPTCFSHNVENENGSQLLVPANATSCEATDQRTEAPHTRKLQISGREGNNDSANPKRLPISSEQARIRAFSGGLHSTPTIHVEVKDPVAINCQGARVVGDYQKNALQSLPSMAVESRRNTSAGEGALHRRNATRRPSNVHSGPKARPKH